MSNVVVVEHREKKLHPHIQIFDDTKKRLANITVPTGSYLQVKNGDMVREGDILDQDPARNRQEQGHHRRSAARRRALSRRGGPRTRPSCPKSTASSNSATPNGATARSSSATIRGAGTSTLIPLGKHLRVHEGDRVKAGDRMSEGAIDPHDVLRIMGENAVQRYLLDEIQSVTACRA